eukprot:6486258-Amphidinium_carterae.2
MEASVQICFHPNEFGAVFHDIPKEKVQEGLVSSLNAATALASPSYAIEQTSQPTMELARLEVVRLPGCPLIVPQSGSSAFLCFKGATPGLCKRVLVNQTQIL